LLLHSYEREFAPHLDFTKQFLTELSRTSAEPIDFIEVSLQPIRVSRSAPEDSMVRHVQSMLAGRQAALVVPIGGPAAEFAQRNRQQLFPGAPMLLAGVDRRFVHSGAMSPNDTAMAVDHEPARLVDNILNILPDTKTIFVVVGTSHLAQAWLVEMKRTFQRFEGRVTFSWANELSFAEMVTRSASLPPHSAILFAILALDAKGVPQIEEQALAELHNAANAPIFGLRSTQLGLGIVGGPLLSIEDLSRNTAAVARRLLGGEAPQSIHAATQTLASPVFDWRELRRWSIDDANLPSGSTVLFREPTTWELYQRPIVAAITVVSVQVMIVVALVANLARRRRAERALRESEGRLRLLSNAAPVMLWVAGPDKLCADVNQVWLDFTGRSIEEERGTGWGDSVHSDDLSEWLETYDSAFARREGFRREYRLRRSDGEYRWVLDTGAPRVLDDGSFAGYIGSAFDVTDLKLARLALSSLSQRLMQAQEHERAWVARELQDDLCQRLIVLTAQLHGLGRSRNGDDEEIRSRVGELSGQFGAVATEIFAISDQLHSSNLARLGLPSATSIFCKELSAQHDVVFQLEDEAMPLEVPNDVAVALFRVMQEAVRNAVRHSGARRVTVALRGRPGEIELEVADTGVGFDPDAISTSPGLGLIGMRERLSLVNGECAIDARPGRGTLIRARVPLDQDAVAFRTETSALRRVRDHRATPGL
jgi:PAS domain S-box-containing protein